MHPYLFGLWHGVLLGIIVCALTGHDGEGDDDATPPPQAQDNMTEVAEDLCLDWLGAQSPEAMTAAVVMAVDRADALDKQPVDIYNELVVVCPGFAQGAGNLPPEVWD